MLSIFSMCLQKTITVETAEFFSTNPVDATHSFPYNENNYYILSTYRLLTSLLVHGVWISVSVESSNVERWKVLLSQSKFKYIHWWIFRLLKIFIMRKILWICLQKCISICGNRFFSGELYKIISSYFLSFSYYILP